MPSNCIRSEKVVKEEFEDTKMYQRGNHNPYIKEEQTTTMAKRTNNNLQNIKLKTE